MTICSERASIKSSTCATNSSPWHRWVHDPYFQYFTGEEFFQHALPHERSGMSHWRKRIGDRLDILLAESLRIAHETGALNKRDLARVTVDTTVQPKNVAFPSDARLLETASTSWASWQASMVCRYASHTGELPNVRR